MNLYLISRNHRSYNTYDSAVVAAESEQDARTIHPSGRSFDDNTPYTDLDDVWINDTWASFADINTLLVFLIGEATEGTDRGVILASFNAG